MSPTSTTDAQVDAGSASTRAIELCDLLLRATDTTDVTAVVEDLSRHGDRLGFPWGVFALVQDGLVERFLGDPGVIPQSCAERARIHAASHPGASQYVDSPSGIGQVRYAIVVQVVNGVEPAGVFGVLFEPSRRPDEVEMKFVEAIGHHISTVLERTHARGRAVYQAKLRREHEMAADVQRSLIPTAPPPTDGFEIAGAYVPTFEVGGDFYDWRVLDDGALAATIGDVSGKGMSAAMVMSMAQMLSRSAMSEGHDQPNALAAVVNSVMYAHLVDIGAFITMFFLIYDPATKVLSYSNAGHSPVVILAADDPVRTLGAHGPPLGVLDKLDLDVGRLQLEEGDLLIACSDGIVEQRNLQGEMFGYERLRTVLERERRCDAQVLVARLLAAVEQFCAGAPVDDDRTIMVLRVR